MEKVEHNLLKVLLQNICQEKNNLLFIENPNSAVNNKNKKMMRKI